MTGAPRFRVLDEETGDEQTQTGNAVTQDGLVLLFLRGRSGLAWTRAHGYRVEWLPSEREKALEAVLRRLIAKDYNCLRFAEAVKDAEALLADQPGGPQ